MTRNFLYYLLFILGTLNVQGQEIVSYEKVLTMTKAQITAQFFFQASFDVDLYRITYTTKSLTMEVDTASGVLAIPDDNSFKFPILVYEHGTVGTRHDVPSEGSNERLVALAYASNGYMCLAPDYLGLGISKGLHPYLHPESEAWVTIDMIKAIKTLTPQLDIHFNEQLFITGYSQGGHACMATCIALQDEPTLTLTAAAPMSGPYSVSSEMIKFTLGNDPYSFCGYLASVFLTTKMAYPEIMMGIEVEDVFKPQYATLVRQFEKEEKGLFVMNNEMIALLNASEGVIKPKLMFKESVLSSLLESQNHPLNAALKKLDVFDWKPEVPLLMVYCKGDDQVTYRNAVYTDSLMNANGAIDVSSINVNTAGTHSSCVIPATFKMRSFFSQFQELGMVGVSTENNDSYKIQPNPARDYITLQIPYSSYNSKNVYQIIFRNIDGKILKRQRIAAGVRKSDISIDDLLSGLVIVQIIDGNKTLGYEKLIVVK